MKTHQFPLRGTTIRHSSFLFNSDISKLGSRTGLRYWLANKVRQIPHGKGGDA